VVEEELKPNAENLEDVGLTLPKVLPTSEEKMGALAQNLHKKGLLPRLRTFKGDIASLIQRKDETVTSIAIKENEKRREERTEARGNSHSTNFLIYIIGIVLIVGTVATMVYLTVLKMRQIPVNVVLEENIIPSRDTISINLSSLSPSSVRENLRELRIKSVEQEGIVALKIGEASGKEISNSKEFNASMQLKMPSALERTLGEKMSIGLFQGRDFFFAFKVKDFGIAFRDMLEWENSLVDNFNPFLKEISTSTASTIYTFRDLIVKNKDTRAAMASKGEVRMIYTFLDKETVLITESEEALKALVDAYVEGNTVR